MLKVYLCFCFVLCDYSSFIYWDCDRFVQKINVADVKLKVLSELIQ